MDNDVIARLRQQKARELEALDIVEEMIRREALASKSPMATIAAPNAGEPPTVKVNERRGRPNGNGNGSGPKTKRRLIVELMGAQRDKEWTTQEIVAAIRSMGIEAKSSNISGELSRMVKMGDLRMAHRGKDRWDGSKWKLA